MTFHQTALKLAEHSYDNEKANISQKTIDCKVLTKVCKEEVSSIHDKLIFSF